VRRRWPVVTARSMPEAEADGLTPDQAAFWSAFLASPAAPPDASARFHSAFGIGDGSEEGARLVLTGIKTATSSRLADFGDQGPPRPGSLSMLLGSGGAPRAIVETLRVWPMSLAQADETFAKAYAEWPDSAAFREGMLQWYQRDDPAFALETPLICETFRVIWARA
jgi:uncharacterized protein YhfF